MVRNVHEIAISMQYECCSSEMRSDLINYFNVVFKIIDVVSTLTMTNVYIIYNLDDAHNFL